METKFGIPKLSHEELNAKAKSFVEMQAHDINCKDDDGATFLYWAVAAGALGYVVGLLYLGANPNIYTNAGDCPVALAIRQGDWEMVDLLERFGGMC